MDGDSQWGDSGSAARRRPRPTENTERDDPPAVAPPTTKSGWGADSTGASVDQPVERPKQRNHWDDSVQDMPVIPDLEEDQEEDITKQIAAPPSVRVQKVQGIQDLSTDMKFSLPTNPEPGVDLSVLTKYLCPQSQVLEADETWDYDGLLHELSSTLRDMDDEPDEKEAVTGAEEPAVQPSKRRTTATRADLD